MSSRVVITGATGGIGREAALALAKDGHSLVLVSRRLDRLVELAQDCLRAGARSADAAALDLADRATGPRVADHVQALGAGDIVLVNVAGVAAFGPFHELSIDEHLRQIEVNLVGLVSVTHALLPQMLESGGGQIINVLSIAAQTTFPHSEAYSASKAGAHAFGKSLSASYRSQGLRVTSLFPGATDTPLWDTQAGSPPREDMLTAQSVGQVVRDLVKLPRDRVVDEMTITPPKGVL
ncbi:MAG: SDR family NAD(P)-dependent oxidoreductase [Fimbriimonadaceae bacterium]|nr:SDR family NAD(P)-dependent oxidoreductase [Fimbriimonadaceae bacterium]